MAGFDNDNMFADSSNVGTFPNSEGADNSTELSKDGDEVKSITQNTSNTASSSASDTIKTAGALSGDAYQKLQVGTSNSWSSGIRSNDPSQWRLDYREDANAAPNNIGPNTPIRTRITNAATGASMTVFKTSVSLASESTAIGSDVDLNVQNIETIANSNARINIQVHPTLGGNAYLAYSGPPNNWAVGVDKSDSNSYKIQDAITGTFPTGTTLLKITTDGEVDLPSNKSLKVPSGTTGERPSTPENGMIRYNASLNALEAYQNGSWGSLGGSGGWAFLSSQTASNSADIQFTSGISATYNDYMILLRSVVPATNDVNLYMDVSINGGSTWLNSGYNSWGIIFTQGGNGETNDTTTFILNFSQGSSRIANTSGEGYTGQLLLQNMTSGGTPYIMGSTAYRRPSGGSYVGCRASGRAPTSITVNAVRFRMSSGNISTGTFSLYGISS